MLNSPLTPLTYLSYVQLNGTSYCFQNITNAFWPLGACSLNVSSIQNAFPDNIHLKTQLNCNSMRKLPVLSYKKDLLPFNPLSTCFVLFLHLHALLSEEIVIYLLYPSLSSPIPNVYYSFLLSSIGPVNGNLHTADTTGQANKERRRL